MTSTDRRDEPEDEVLEFDAVLDRDDVPGHSQVLGRSEVLGEGPSWLTERWAGLSPRRRQAIAVLAALIVAGPTVVIGIGRARDWRAERALRDEVVVAAELEVLASSTSPPGGSVWFSVVVRNEGRRPVQVVDVRAVTADLTITVAPQGLRRLQRVMPLQPGDAARVTVSALLDCPAAPTEPTEASPSMTARIVAVPLSGRRRTVDVPLASATLITDIAATSCRFRPDASGVEISGPVAPR